jgi:hypothetical protein
MTSLPESDASLRTILERQNKTVTPEAVAGLRAQLAATFQAMNKAGKFGFTQVDENIAVNQNFTAADFVP